MAKDLFVKRYKAVADSDNLRKVGEIRLEFKRVDSPTASTQSFASAVNVDMEYTIINDGYFTDATLTQNLGKTITVNAGSSVILYVSNGSIVSIPDKYNFKFLNLNQGGNNISNKSFDVSQLAYSPLVDLYLSGASGVYGDFSGIDASLNVLNVEYTKITGSADNVLKRNVPPHFRVGRCALGFDIALIKNAIFTPTAGGYLFSVNENSEVYGDVSVLAGKSGFTTENNCIFFRNCPKLYGDISNLVADSLQCEGSKFTWVAPRTQSTILGINGADLGNTIDAMLIDQAPLAVSETASAEWLRLINVFGTKTSASDSAVATLKGKGFTVIVNGVTL